MKLGFLKLYLEIFKPQISNSCNLSIPKTAFDWFWNCIWLILKLHLIKYGTWFYRRVCKYFSYFCTVVLLEHNGQFSPTILRSMDLNWNFWSFELFENTAFQIVLVSSTCIHVELPAFYGKRFFLGKVWTVNMDHALYFSFVNEKRDGMVSMRPKFNLLRKHHVMGARCKKMNSIGTS